MNELELLLDLHRNSARQGPGGDEATRLAISLSGLTGAKNLKIADIGCGSGASTLVLAEELDSHITAIDFLPDFLKQLNDEAQQKGLSERVDTLAISMEELSFDEGSLDVIWSEGAIYNIGFQNGIKAWRRFLKPQGILAVSELTWLTEKRPKELSDHWANEYPEVATASQKIGQLEENGYMLLGYFPLPKSNWLDNYYQPMQGRFDAYLSKHEGSEAAQEIVAAEQREIDLYERFSDYVSYGFYIAKKLED